MDWKELTGAGAVVGTVIGWGVGALWLHSYIKALNKIIFRDGGGLNIVTIESCRDCQRDCEKTVDGKIDSKLLLLSSIKQSIDTYHEMNERRYSTNERRMQLLTSINAGTANFMRVIAERRRADENTTALEQIINRVEGDIKDLGER